MTKPALSPIQVVERRQLVERLYLEGIPTPRIVDAVRRKFGTAKKRNIENDIHLIRKRWKKQAEHLFADDVTGWWVQLALNDRRSAIRGGDLRLGYKIGCDIARMAGVNLRGEQITVNVNLDQARAYLDTIMQIVFAHVTDEDTRQAILADLAAVRESA